MKCVEIVVEEKPAPPTPPPTPPTPPEEKIPWEYLALGAGVAVPVLGVLIYTEMGKK